MLVPDLHAAAQHLHQVGDDIAFKDTHIVRLQAVEDLAPDGHDALKLRVSGQLAGAQCGVALHDIDLPLFRVTAAAVHKFLDPVGDVDAAGELFLHALPGPFRRLPAALVDKHLLGDPVRLRLIFNEIDLQLLLEKLGHGRLDKAVGDRLLVLVFIGGLVGKAVGHQNEAVLHVLKLDGAFALLILADLFDIGVDGIGKGVFHRLVRRAAVFQPGGVVVILQRRHLVGKAESGGELDLVFGHVLPVPAPALAGDEAGGGQRFFSCKLRHIVKDAVFIAVIRGLKLSVLFHLQPEGDAGVHHRLPAHDIVEIFLRNVDVRKDFPVRPPADGGAGLFPVCRFNDQLLTFFAADLALFKMELILVPVAPDGHIHIL